MGLTGSATGLLKLEDGRLSFELFGRGALAGRHMRKLEQMTQLHGLAKTLEDDDKAKLFDLALDELDRIIFPWYYFDTAFNLISGGAKYRFSFIRPQNTIVNTKYNIGQAVDAGRNITQARSIGKLWKKILAKK